MARGFGTTFGTSGTTDRIVGGTNITLGTTMSMAFWTWRNGNGGAGFGTVLSFSNAGFTLYSGMYNNGSSTYDFERRWTTIGRWNFARPAASEWHHICITYDGGSTANVPVVYVDGSAVSVSTSLAPTGSLATITQAPHIGNDISAGDAWDGKIAEVGFWNNTILTANEAASLAHGLSPTHVRHAALTTYLPLWGTQTAEHDLGPNHYTWTVTGALRQPGPGIILPPFQERPFNS